MPAHDIIDDRNKRLVAFGDLFQFSTDLETASFSRLSNLLSGLVFGQGFHMDRPEELDGFDPVLKEIGLDLLYLRLIQRPAELLISLP